MLALGCVLLAVSGGCRKGDAAPHATGGQAVVMLLVCSLDMHPRDIHCLLRKFDQEHPVQATYVSSGGQLARATHLINVEISSLLPKRECPWPHHVTPVARFFFSLIGK